MRYIRKQRVNANKHTERGIKALDNSIRTDGWIGAMTVAADGETFDGSARLEAIDKSMPSAEPIIVETDGTRPVVVKRTDIPNADDPRAKRLGIAANVIAHMDYAPDGDILAMIASDDDAVMKLIRQDETSDEAVRKSINSTGDADAEPQIDRAAELNEKWQVKTGDLWRIGEHRLLCGDSKLTEDVHRVMQGDRAQLVFTDPPYGVSVGAKNRLLDSFQKAGSNLTDIEDDDATPEELKERLLPAFKNIKALIMADDCTVFVTAPQGGELSMMMMMMRESGLPTRHVLIWKKNQPTFSMGRLDYDYQHEPILLTWGKRHKRPMLGKHKTSIWEIDKPRASSDHPTMKPVELVVNALMNNSDAGDVSFDAYCGSGTSIVAAEQTRRKCRAIEISPNYCAVILERMATAFPDIVIERLSDGPTKD